MVFSERNRGTFLTLNPNAMREAFCKAIKALNDLCDFGGDFLDIFAKLADNGIGK